MKRTRKKKPEKKVEFDLTKKYRPQTMEDLCGNSVLKRSLKSLIDNKKIPNCILFTGPYGTGKTTLARILAKELECSDFDLNEIDVADFSGIDTARQIRRTIKSKPMQGKVKVWILDEVALLGRGGASEKNEAQSALLKALEEPPPYCYFFLCTTDPQNVLKTLKSRCVQYSLSALTDKQMFKFLNDVAEKEGVNLPKKVNLQIVRDSLGHARDALKILQKIIHLDEEEMLESAQQEAIKRSKSIELCKALAKKNSWKTISAILKDIDDLPENTRRTIRGYFKNVLLNGSEWAFIVLDAFASPFYNIDGENELVRCTYEAWSELND